MTELKSPASEKRKFALWISKETIEVLSTNHCQLTLTFSDA